MFLRGMVNFIRPASRLMSFRNSPSFQKIFPSKISARFASQSRNYFKQNRMFVPSVQKYSYVNALGMLGAGAALLTATAMGIVVAEEKKSSFLPKKPRVDLDMVGGYEYIIEDIVPIVKYLQDPDDYTKKKLPIIKGILLSGPPGVGKSYLAEAIAGYSGVPIYIVNASEILGKYVGQAEENLRELFKSAENLKKPCVILIDEIDSIASKRFATPEHGAEHHVNTLVNQLLTLLAEDHPGIVVIATTNNFKNLDPAVIRAGRFDKCIEVNMPNENDRRRILSTYLEKRRVDATIQIDVLAKSSFNFSSAKLVAWVNEAVMIATKDNDGILTQNHFDMTRDIIQQGTKGHVEDDLSCRTRNARHEIGHAFVGHYLEKKIYQVSVLKTTGRNGNTEFLYEKENRLLTKNELLDIVCIKLAGRAAEIIFSHIQEGSENDLHDARNIVMRMIQNEGMGATLSGASHITEVEAILQEQLQRATDIITKNMEDFNLLVNALVARHVLYRDDFLNILRWKSLKPDSNHRSFSFWANKNNENSKCDLPPKKQFSSLESSEISPVVEKKDPNEKPFPFTLEEVCQAIEVDPNRVRKMTWEWSGTQIKIHFKPGFSDHAHMNKISKVLKQNDVANAYFEHYSNYEYPELTISKDNLEDFVKYVKSKSAQVTPEATPDVPPPRPGK